jgi:hypothetical protein
MIRSTLIFLFSTCLFLVPAHAQTKVFTGYIHDTMQAEKDNAIEMHLRRVGDQQIFGYYFHMTHPKLIHPLHTKFSEYAVQLFDGNEADGQVYFDGILHDSTLNGKWRDLPAFRFFDFDLNLKKIDTVSKQKDKLAGYYELTKPDASKNMRIVLIDNTHFYFAGNIGSKKCTGYIYGIAKMTGANTATYSDPKCKQITFTFAPKTINIVEKNCNQYHGSACNFTGIYKLKK